MDLVNVGPIAGIVAAIIAVVYLGYVLGHAYFKRRQLTRKYFRIRWKGARRLRPKDLLRERACKERGYKEYYYLRDEDERIAEAIKNEKNVLLIGPPLGGKTRAAYEAFKRRDVQWWRDVLIPEHEGIEREGFKLPRHFKFWRRGKRTVFIDDLQIFAEKRNFEHLVHLVLEKRITFVATCRSGAEFKGVKAKMAGVNLYVETVFGDNVVELGRVERGTGEEIADEAGVNWGTVKFDGTVGSVFMPLREMDHRFEKDCNYEERAVLRVLKDMYTAGIFVEDIVFPKDWVEITAANEGVQKEKYEWDSLFGRLTALEFISVKDKSIKAEEVYLEDVVVSVTEREQIDVLNEMLTTFADVPEALFRLGNRAYDLGLYVLEKASYMKLAIAAYSKSSESFSLKDAPTDFAITQNNLGNAYVDLAEVEDKAENCRRAVAAYEEALKVRTLDPFPTKYAMTQNNLGTAYGALAEVEDRADNCRLAIAAYEEALKVRTPDRFPREYAATRNNLGIAYQILAEVEDKAENCKRAIDAYEEALKVYTLDRFPMDYATTRNNLGNAYRTLAEAEDKAGNCRRAIKACEKALNVRTLDRFPMDYAATQNNLGNAYQRLAEAEDKAENCGRAIAAFEEALKVYTTDRFPMDYAMTQNNLGVAYWTLGEVEDKAENCRLALNSFKEALEVYKEQGIHEGVRMVERNIKLLKEFCGEE